MPAPTAALSKSEQPLSDISPRTENVNENEDDVVLDTTMSDEHAADTAPGSDAPMQIDDEGRPRFAPAKANTLGPRSESRKVPIPPHRMTPLKNNWTKIYAPLVEHLKLQVRMNLKSRSVELRTHRNSTETGAVQKGADFIKAFALGFDLDDAIALLRLDDLYIDTFEVKDVKTLQGDHLARAIGRIAGKDGKTKFAIENTTRTRIVLADQKIHILGGYQNINTAKRAICDLIMGAQPGKVYGHLRTVAARQKERF